MTEKKGWWQKFHEEHGETEAEAQVRVMREKARDEALAVRSMEVLNMLRPVLPEAAPEFKEDRFSKRLQFIRDGMVTEVRVRTWWDDPEEGD